MMKINRDTGDVLPETRHPGWRRLLHDLREYPRLADYGEATEADADAAARKAGYADWIEQAATGSPG
jgi:hypothetical protein